MGFEKNNAGPTNYGLNIMQERAEEIGADLTIESQPNKGTCIYVRLSTDHVTSHSEIIN
jgi:nitrate/nitrite-specific signal transduction histidine kinase